MIAERTDSMTNSQLHPGTPYSYPPPVIPEAANAQHRARDDRATTFSPVVSSVPLPGCGDAEQGYGTEMHTSSTKGIFSFRRSKLWDLVMLTGLQLRRILMFGLPAQYRSRLTHLSHKASSLEELLQKDSEGIEPDDKSELDVRQVKLAIRRKERLNKAWGRFIGSLLREWKYCNIIFALIVSAILSMLQIDLAMEFVVARTAALMSLLLSLGGIILATTLSLYFSKMQTFNDRAFQWTKVIAPKGHESEYLNIWVIMALPVVTLVWSVILFMTSIMAFSYVACQGLIEYGLYASLLSCVVASLLWVASEVHSYRIEAAASFPIPELPSADVSQRGESLTPAFRPLPELNPVQEMPAVDYHAAISVSHPDRQGTGDNSWRMRERGSSPFSYLSRQGTNTESIDAVMEGIISPPQPRGSARPHPLSQQSTIDSLVSTEPEHGLPVEETEDTSGAESVEPTLHSEPESYLHLDDESDQVVIVTGPNDAQTTQAAPNIKLEP
ncbi:hypothetical protein AX16_007190 [Volvariella volvacea WC 439]|nr:hypothetical protein AX16_007190 [Volvariella volvacea WC 439]